MTLPAADAPDLLVVVAVAGAADVELACDVELAGAEVVVGLAERVEAVELPDPGVGLEAGVT